MFCFQCQEAMKCSGCTMKGMCGKEPDTANLQDLLIHTLKGTSLLAEVAKKKNQLDKSVPHFIMDSMFATITNANFDEDRFVAYTKEALEIRDKLKGDFGDDLSEEDKLKDCITWTGDTKEEFLQKAPKVGVLSTENEDARSLRELIVYGLKGIAAYAHHAKVLGVEDQSIYDFMIEGLCATTRDLNVDTLVGLVMKTGETAVTTMATLDKANTEAYGNPEISEVNIGVGEKPGILISGHDLKDMEALLKQTEGTGIDVYTHSEMLPANYYPAFKKYKHLRGNYGGSWWKQNKEFEAFNGPILMTTNCITPVKDSYKDRIFTTSVVGYKDVKHIPGNADTERDFSGIIELAKQCKPPQEIETGKIVGGFAHNQVMQLADKVVDAVKSGAIKKFVVMAGCDGRQKGREYFTGVAEELPNDAVILTAGCAKYRYNKLNLGDIGGIPRVLDAGQCNDSYSLAVIALKLKEVFGLDDINKLPISYDIAWYEQKAVAVLLALLSLGVKNIKLGPTLPAFLSLNVAKVLVEKCNIHRTGEVKGDVQQIMA